MLFSNLMVNSSFKEFLIRMISIISCISFKI